MFAQVDKEEFNVEEVDDTTKRDKYVHFFNSEDMLEYEPEEEPKEFKKKKKKRRVYYDLKTKRGFTKKGRGSHMEVQVFHYLKVYKEPSRYVKDIYWYDTKKKKIVKSTPNKVDPKVAKILHGPYKKIIGDETVQKGVYYIGTKHARWETLTKSKVHKFDTTEVEWQSLKIKQKYNRGFPKDSELKYYDSESTQLKEVMPIIDGEPHGLYFAFFENGKVKTQGRYHHGEKVGKWYEYHMGVKRHFKQKITVYPNPPGFGRKKKPEEKEITEPYILKEWDTTGHVIYDKVAEDKKKRLEQNK